MALDDINPATRNQSFNETYEFLRGLGYDVAWHEYPVMHQLCQQEVDDISTWLKECFDLGN